MREFFRPFRRKLGVLVLIMACSLTVGWVRSGYVAEFFAIASTSGQTHVLMSHDGMIGWGRRDSAPREVFYFYIPAPYDPFIGMEMKNRWRLLGIDAAAGVFPYGITLRYVLVPYALIVLPLTLLSARLLLWKGRKQVPGQPTGERVTV